MKAPNFLILDEPTNDLDIETMSVLETFLQSYKGTLLVVSHDRYFMDRIVDHCFVSKGKGEWQDFPGNYSDYREYLDLQEQASREEESKSPKIQQSNSSPSIKKEQNKKKRSYKEQYELDQIEKDIPQLKEKIKVIEENLNQQTTDFEKITELSEELGALKEELDQKEWRWLELNED
jgi:ATP-binding cassette subfamily F protein uup